MDDTHPLILQAVFNQLRNDPEPKSLEISAKDGNISVNKSVICLFSPFLRRIIDSIPHCSDSVLMLPDISIDDVGHILNILNTGYTNILSESSINYLSITSNAKTLGIPIELTNTVSDEKIKNFMNENYESEKDKFIVEQYAIENKISPDVIEQEDSAKHDLETPEKELQSSATFEEDQINVFIFASDRGWFRCKICYYHAKDNVAVQNHILIKHMDTILGHEKMSCHKCFKVYSCKYSLDVHVKSMHNNIRVKCDQCEKSFGT